VQILSTDGQNPTDEPSNFFAFDFKGKIAQFKICAASTTIAIDWSILSKRMASTQWLPPREKTVSA
jgi:hypothetical protein